MNALHCLATLPLATLPLATPLLAPHPLPAIVLAAPPTTPAETHRIQARLDTASQLFESGLPADALAVLTTIEAELGLEGEAAFPLLRFMMARCLAELNRPDEALQALARFAALARTPDEQALAVEWRDRIRARHYATLHVDCPPGATAHLDAAHLEAPADLAAPAAPHSQPCPARFDHLPAAPTPVRVTGAGPDRHATADLRPGETTTITPQPPATPPPWWHIALSLGGGAATLVGELPDFVEPTLGGTARAALFGELHLWRMLWLRAGLGYAFESLRYQDTDIDADGTWLRQTLDIPLALRAELPWASLALEAGGGPWFLLAVDEQQGSTTAVDDAFEPIGGRLTLGIDRHFALDPLTLRLALRHHHGLTPALRDADARPIALEVTLDIVY